MTRAARSVFFGSTGGAAGIGVLVAALLAFPAFGESQARDQAPPPRPHRLVLAYDIFVGGFHAGHVDLSVRLKTASYELFAVTRSAGLIDYLVRFRSYAQTRGTLDGSNVRPVSHHVNNLWTGDVRFVRMGYVDRERDHHGPVYTVVHPRPGTDEREPVPLAERRDTVDPLSAALRAAYAAWGRGGNGPCGDIIPVFDGRRRYNLVFEGTGAGSVDGPYFKGPARKCLVSIRRIVGFSSNPFLPRSKDAESGEIWFADLVPGWPPVPVRFKTDIGLGNALVHLVGLEPR